MKILHLTLNKKWYDMIESGEKTTEYREMKPYWFTRLLGRWYDAVIFRNGYSKTARKMMFEINAISTGLGLEAWGAPCRDRVFMIHLGKRLELPQ